MKWGNICRLQVSNSAMQTKLYIYILISTFSTSATLPNSVLVFISFSFSFLSSLFLFGCNLLIQFIFFSILVNRLYILNNKVTVSRYALSQWYCAWPIVLYYRPLLLNAQGNLVTMAIITIILHLLILSVAFISIIYNLKQKHHPHSVAGRNRIIMKLLNVIFFFFLDESLQTLSLLKSKQLCNGQTARK